MGSSAGGRRRGTGPGQAGAEPVVASKVEITPSSRTPRGCTSPAFRPVDVLGLHDRENAARDWSSGAVSELQGIARFTFHEGELEELKPLVRA